MNRDSCAPLEVEQEARAIEKPSHAFREEILISAFPSTVPFDINGQDRFNHDEKFRLSVSHKRKYRRTLLS